jgi:hypothetical protein
MVDFPAPFGPVIAVVPRESSKEDEVWDLMFSISILEMCIGKLGLWLKSKQINCKEKGHGRSWVFNQM